MGGGGVGGIGIGIDVSEKWMRVGASLLYGIEGI